MKENQTKPKQSIGRGGARPNSGRKPGSANQKTRLIAEKATAAGITPLEYMLNLMRDEAAEGKDRFEAAKSAAPYIHPRLAAVEVTGEGGTPLMPTTISFVRDADQP